MESIIAMYGLSQEINWSQLTTDFFLLLEAIFLMLLDIWHKVSTKSPQISLILRPINRITYDTDSLY